MSNFAEILKWGLLLVCFWTLTDSAPSDLFDEQTVLKELSGLLERYDLFPEEATGGYADHTEEDQREFTNEWVVHLKNGAEADEIANEMGYVNKGEVRGFKNYYVFERPSHPSRHKREAVHHTKRLADDTRVRSFSRDLFLSQLSEQVEFNQNLERCHFEWKNLLKTLFNGQPKKVGVYLHLWQKSYCKSTALKSLEVLRDVGFHALRFSMVRWVEQQASKLRSKRDFMDFKKVEKPSSNLLFNDPLWSKEWYLHDTRTSIDLPKLDLHVVGAWKKGYTGKGVSVSILDDGIQWNHTDLYKNYDPDASYDLNDNDKDPMPTFNAYNKHGTRCAGEVAMVANNGVCGVGVAYDAKIGGIRMLDGRITDRLEAEALQFNIDHVDVFSASWGPNDDGKTVEGPGTLAYRAIENGIQKGRQGKGVIYVWASGNGGTYQDNCDCDGYTDSIFTLSISSASQSGQFPWYGEQCASTIATTYSSGAFSDQKIVTTDIPNTCTVSHSGTSASAPLAAGIVALGLEANPKLSWRDVQYIAVWTSEPAPLINNNGWSKNGRGLYVNTRFGFGLMNAEAFVTAAESWKAVPDQKICKTIFPSFRTHQFDPSHPGKIRFQTDACKGQKNEIKYLEHVQLVTDIDYTRRGNLAIFLVSPSGTRAQLLSPRKRDDSKLGFRRWPFMSVHSWGEDPAGWWELHLVDQENINGDDQGSVKNLTLILYGTTDMPHHYKDGRVYDMGYNKVGDRDLQQKNKKLKLGGYQNGAGAKFPMPSGSESWGNLLQRDAPKVDIDGPTYEDENFIQRDFDVYEDTDSR